MKKIFKNLNGVMGITMGDGDIVVGGVMLENKKTSDIEGSICFKKGEKGEVGRDIITGESNKESFESSDFALSFKNVKSVDVVIKQLLIIRQKLTYIK